MTQPADPDVTLPPPTLPLPEAPPEPAAAPEGVPGYEILSELGRGGMGVVYQARQKALNRIVALKMILAGGHAGEEALARFQTEAEAIARLQHPGIVQVYEVGAHGGLPWIALEFCAGGSLERQLAGQPQPPASAAALVEALARAVQAAHERGVVHRDLKPANVLLSVVGQAASLSPGAAGQAGSLSYVPKITDFGLAKRLDDASGATRTGSIMGTPSYMAPEQAEAKKDVGPPADVYSLGAILYECLTGRPPFRAATPLDTILQVVTDEPVPPSQLVARLPRDLETICLKCLQKDPARRYASAGALADDLAAFRDGRPITARPVGAAERAWRWAKRNRAVAAAGLVAALALLGGGVASTVSLLRARASAEQAREHARDADEARRQAEDLDRENRRQSAGLSVWRGQQLLRDDPIAALPWLDQAARLDPDQPLHRRRLDRVLRGVPRPVHLWRMGGAVNQVVVSPDGALLAACDGSGLVRVWNLETGELVGPDLKHPHPVLALAFSPDGRHLATGGGAFLRSGELRVYDPRSGQQVEKPIGGPSAFALVGFSADDKRLFAADFSLLGGSGRTTFRAYERGSGKVIEAGGNYFFSSPTAGEMERWFHRGTGRLLVVEEKQSRVVELGRERTVAGPWPHAGTPWDVRLSPDGRWFTLFSGTGGPGSTAKVRDLASGREYTLAISHSWRPLDVGVYSGDEAAIAFHDGTVQRYRLSTGALIADSHERPGSPGWRCAFSADGGFLVGQGEDDKVRLWQVPAWAPLSPWLPQGGRVTAHAVASGGRLLLTGTANGVVRAWDLARTDEPSWLLDNAPRGPTEVPFDDRGRALIVGHGQLMTVEPATGKVLPFTANEPKPGRTALSPDGKLLAVGAAGQVRLIDVGTHKDARPPLRMQQPAVLDVAFSPDGRRLAARASPAEALPTSVLGEARVWDLDSGKELVHLPSGGPAEPGGVAAIAVSPDGRRLGAATVRMGLLNQAGLVSEVRLIDLATGKVERALPASAPDLTPVRLAFRPDGRRLAVLSQNVILASDEVAVWDVTDPQRSMWPIRPSGRVSDVAFRADGKHLAVAAGTEVQAWDVESQRLAFRLPHRDPVHQVRYTGGGAVLLAISEGREVTTWDASSGESLGPPARHPAGVASAGVSPDRNWLVAAGFDRRMYAWFLGGELLAPIQGRLARLISGQSVQGATTTVLPLDDLEADLRYLRREVPPYLTSNDLMRRAWHIVRLNQLVNAGAWGSAANQFERVAPQPGQATWWDYQEGTCRLGVGDLAGVRRCCERMLRRDHATMQQVEVTVKLCLLAPGTLPDPRPAFELARRLEKADEKDPLYLWYQLARGLAAYRQGKLDEAAATLARGRSKAGAHGSDLTASALLAMTRARQGKHDQAKELLAAVEKDFAQPERVNWIERLQLQAVLEEARREVGKR